MPAHLKDIAALPCETVMIQNRINSKTQYYTIQYNTIQYNTIQYNIKLITRHM